MCATLNVTDQYEDDVDVGKFSIEERGQSSTDLDRIIGSVTWEAGRRFPVQRLGSGYIDATERLDEAERNGACISEGDGDPCCPA